VFLISINASSRKATKASSQGFFVEEPAVKQVFTFPKLPFYKTDPTWKQERYVERPEVGSDPFLQKGKGFFVRILVPLFCLPRKKSPSPKKCFMAKKP